MQAQQGCIRAGDWQEGALDLGSSELVTQACPSLERDRSLTVTKAVPARNMSWRGPRALKDKGWLLGEPATTDAVCKWRTGHKPVPWSSLRPAVPSFSWALRAVCLRRTCLSTSLSSPTLYLLQPPTVHLTSLSSWRTLSDTSTPTSASIFIETLIAARL